MKLDGKNFKHMRVCERCGNTFETGTDTVYYCPNCVKKIIDDVIYIRKELGKYMKKVFQQRR